VRGRGVSSGPPRECEDPGTALRFLLRPLTFFQKRTQQQKQLKEALTTKSSKLKRTKSSKLKQRGREQKRGNQKKKRSKKHFLLNTVCI
jgi:hypothetical protein